MKKKKKEEIDPKIQDLQEQIERLKKMIELHSDNPSDVMLKQYKAMVKRAKAELKKVKK